VITFRFSGRFIDNSEARYAPAPKLCPNCFGPVKASRYQELVAKNFQGAPNNRVALTLLVATVVFLFFNGLVFALEVPRLQGYVNDYADITSGKGRTRK
jgi:hypothetical protein